nr:hypothetical protein [Nocardia carnea]
MNAETLRHYERRGLLAEPDRGLGRHCQYRGRPTVIVHQLMLSWTLMVYFIAVQR